MKILMFALWFTPQSNSKANTTGDDPAANVPLIICLPVTGITEAGVLLSIRCDAGLRTETSRKTVSRLLCFLKLSGSSV
jgi:hypothetical protein